MAADSLPRITLCLDAWGRGSVGRGRRKEGYEKIAVRRRPRECSKFQLRERERGADKKAWGGLGGPIKGLQHFVCSFFASRHCVLGAADRSTHGAPATKARYAIRYSPCTQWCKKSCTFEFPSLLLPSALTELPSPNLAGTFLPLICFLSRACDSRFWPWYRSCSKGCYGG